MPEPAFQPGEALLWVTVENGFNSRRMVTYQEARSDHAAIVTFGLERLSVAISELSRPTPPQPPATIGKWFETPKPPTPPTEAQLDDKLTAARQALARSHERVKAVQARVDAARAVVDRASNEQETARAALRTHDQHQKAAQHALEESLRTGCPLPSPVSNGHDPRHYLTDKTTMAEQALAKFQGELADRMQQMGEALSATRKASADIISLLVQRETEALRALEIQAATARAELLAVCSWWPDATLGAIPLPRVTSGYLEQQPAWQDVTQVRLGGAEGRIRPWKSLFAKLVNGDTDADFTLEE
jgi:hypothetical protein